MVGVCAIVTGCFNSATDPCQVKMTGERSLKGHLCKRARALLDSQTKSQLLLYVMYLPIVLMLQGNKTTMVTTFIFKCFLLKNKFSKLKRQNRVYTDKMIEENNSDTMTLGPHAAALYGQ